MMKYRNIHNRSTHLIVIHVSASNSEISGHSPLIKTTTSTWWIRCSWFVARMRVFSLSMPVLNIVESDLNLLLHIWGEGKLKCIACNKLKWNLKWKHQDWAFYPWLRVWIFFLPHPNRLLKEYRPWHKCPPWKKCFIELKSVLQICGGCKKIAWIYRFRNSCLPSSHNRKHIYTYVLYQNH